MGKRNPANWLPCGHRRMTPVGGDCWQCRQIAEQAERARFDEICAQDRARLTDQVTIRTGDGQVIEYRIPRQRRRR